MDDCRCPYKIFAEEFRKGNVSELTKDKCVIEKHKGAECKKNLVAEHKLRMTITELRFSDKKITAIGTKLCTFNNLKSLILSGNLIESLANTELPKNLELLELGNNLISTIEDFVYVSLPSLRYLGLSLNRIRDFFNPNLSICPIFPNIINLDLSYNSLSDLENVVSSLKTLTKLRILLLTGNPFAFSPGYRGYVEIKLSALINLDEKLITLYERRGWRQWLESGGSFDVSSVDVSVQIIRILNAPIAIKLTRKTIGSVKDECKFRVECSWPAEPEKPSIESIDEKDSDLPNKSYHTHSTPGLPWNEPIEFYDTFVIRCKNVKNVFEFLDKEMTVAILEDKESGPQDNNVISRGIFTVPFNLLKTDSEIHFVWNAIDHDSKAKPVTTNLRNKVTPPPAVHPATKKFQSIMSIAVEEPESEITCHVILALRRQSFE